jgi:Tfp pilus assembly protein PilN
MTSKTIIYLVFAVALVFGLNYYYKSKIEEIQIQNELLIKENESLYNKISLIESSFDKFMDKGNLRPSRRTSPKPKIKVSKDETVKELVKIKKEIVDLDKTMDSIKQTLPNRTGQDLINSLKMKTEL